MPTERKRAGKAEGDAVTHHSRYPARIHDHLSAAADAAQAVSAPVWPETAGDQDNELAGRERPAQSQEGASDE